MMQDLRGTVALVTGGAQGLGAAICRVLGAAGAVVVAADLQEERAAETVRSIHADGGEGMALRLDVTDATQAAEAVRQIVARYDRLDILINNAGLDVTLPVEELSVADFDRVLAVNLRGPFLLAKAVFPVMKQRGRGHIVNITSTAAKRTWANATAYHASKWGLLGLSHALHVEGRACGIKVTAIVNGGMRTPFILDRFPDTPLENLQDPKNVAETIRFLLMQPDETVIPEVTVLPVRETSWP
jgi:NAD(P)-dependent dehydrogenase (short-subunit alcohol dehydrogenase family)